MGVPFRLLQESKSRDPRVPFHLQVNAVQAGGYVGGSLRAAELLGPAGLQTERTEEGRELPLAPLPLFSTGSTHQRTPSWPSRNCSRIVLADTPSHSARLSICT